MKLLAIFFTAFVSLSAAIPIAPVSAVRLSYHHLISQAIATDVLQDGIREDVQKRVGSAQSP